jgi:hypothetical protein
MLLRHEMLLRITLIVSGMCATCALSAAPGTKQGDLRAFLRHYLKDHHLSVDGTTRYSAAPVVLDGKTEMELVYLSGPWWCGSGGCTALLLEPQQSSFRVMQKLTLVGLPIRVLPSVTHGWHDMAMWVRGAGMSGQVVVLQYDGMKYPDSPLTAPPLAPNEPMDGFELPLNGQGEALHE